MEHHPRRRESFKPADVNSEYYELSQNESDAPILPQVAQETGYDPAAPTNTNDLDVQMPLGQAIKRYPKVVLYCLGITLAIVGWGYGLVISGSITTVDAFQEDFGVYNEDEGGMIIPAFWLSLWMGLSPAGAGLGSVVGGWLGDSIGRKYSLMVGSIVSAVAVTCMFFSWLGQLQDTKRIILTVGLVVQGISVGIIRVTSLTYVSENAPAALRGSAMALFPTFTLFGQLLGLVVVFVINGIEGPRGYLGAIGSMWILALAPFILSCFMPDSPAHLIRKGQEEKALRSSKRLFAPKIDPYIALEKVRATIEEEKTGDTKVNYIACFQGTNLRRTLIVFLANVIPSVFGLDLLSNGSIFMKTVGMDSSPALLLMIGGIVAGMLANAAGIWILSRAGRRNMTIASLVVAGILWGAMGVCGFFSGDVFVWIGGGVMIAVIAVAGMGCWPASFAIMGETSSLQLRSASQGLGGVATQGASISLAVALPYIFNPDAANLGLKTGFLYCGLCLIFAIISFFFLPEMKDRSMVEIDHMFEMRLPTRQFKTFKMDEGVSTALSPSREFEPLRTAP